MVGLGVRCGAGSVAGRSPAHKFCCAIIHPQRLIWSRPVNTEQVAGSCTVEIDDVGVGAEKAERVWNVPLKRFLVCACAICAHVSVAETFEDCRGLRGMVAAWRRMYGPFAGWLYPPPPPGVRVRFGNSREDVCFEEVIYHCLLD